MISKFEDWDMYQGVECTDYRLLGTTPNTNSQQIQTHYNKYYCNMQPTATALQSLLPSYQLLVIGPRLSYKDKLNIFEFENDITNRLTYSMNSNISINNNILTYFSKNW